MIEVKKPSPYLALRQQKRFLTGNDLLSQGVSPQVPSALEGLTSWFGMEQGVSPPLESPEEPCLAYGLYYGGLFLAISYLAP